MRLSRLVGRSGGRVETHGFEYVNRAVAAGRRMIVFSGHIANWEIGMLAGVQHGISVAQIYRAANNPLMDRMIARYRGDQGEFVSKGRRSRAAAITALRRGTHLGLLADQKMNDGIPVPFFGRPAMIAPALAVCDVLPLRVERLDGARFRVTVFPPLPLPRSGEPPANVAALMAEVNATLEAWIRDRPEQWLWVHQRWPDCCCYLNRYLYTGDLSQRNTNGIQAELPSPWPAQTTLASVDPG